LDNEGPEYWQEKCAFFRKNAISLQNQSFIKNFFAKIAYIGVKSCEKSIARIPEA